MEKLKNMEEYKNLLGEVKSVCKHPFSNIYFMKEDIERYIMLGRGLYEKQQAGVIFYFDEENYYIVCLYVDAKKEFIINTQDKKILIKNIYKANSKKSNMLLIETKLQLLGFEKKGTSVQIQGNTLQILDHFKKVERYVKKLEAEGYQCICADWQQFAQIEEMVLDSQIIKDYQLSYHTDDEKKKMEKGVYLCVLNPKKEICAASIMEVINGISQGTAIVVKDEYKMKGIPSMLGYYRHHNLACRHIDVQQAWILIDNIVSLNYHKSIGFSCTSKYADEWILA